MFFDWLMINPHLFPSLICVLAGFALLALAPIFYQIRTKKPIITNPILAIKEYTKTKKRIMAMGAVIWRTRDSHSCH